MAIGHGIPTGRERVWAIILERGEVDRRDFAAAGILPHTVSTFLGDLCRTGLLERAGTVGVDGGWLRRYRLVEDASPAEGRVVSKRRAVDWRRQAWQTMRIQRAFTLPALMVAFSGEVDISYSTVSRFVRELALAGYVRVAGRTSLGHSRWRLVRDTGPLPPPRKVLLEEKRRCQTG